MAIRARIIQIGNSQGIRIPKPILEQVGLKGEVEIEVQGKQLVVSAAAGARAGWDAAFADMAAAGEDQMMDGDAPPATPWDAQDWQWR